MGNAALLPRATAFRSCVREIDRLRSDRAKPDQKRAEPESAGMSLRQRLLSQSTIIFGARLFGAGLTFLAQVAIARFVGAEALGDTFSSSRR